MNKSKFVEIRNLAKLGQERVSSVLVHGDRAKPDGAVLSRERLPVRRGDFGTT